MASARPPAPGGHWFPGRRGEAASRVSCIPKQPETTLTSPAACKHLQRLQRLPVGRLWVWVLIRECHGGARGHLAQPPALQTGNDLQAVVSFRLSRQLLGVLQKTSRFFLKDLTTPDHLPIKQRCPWWQLQGARQEISVCVRARARVRVYVRVCACARIRVCMRTCRGEGVGLSVSPSHAPSLTTPPQKQPLRAERTRVLP